MTDSQGQDKWVRFWTFLSHRRHEQRDSSAAGTVGARMALGRVAALPVIFVTLISHVMLGLPSLMWASPSSSRSGDAAPAERCPEEGSAVTLPLQKAAIKEEKNLKFA